MALLGVMQISYAQEKEGYSTEPAHSATFLKNGFGIIGLSEPVPVRISISATIIRMPTFSTVLR